MRWGWIITLPLTVIVVVFAVMNRASVHVELWPWPWDAEAPLFVLIGVTFILGFLVGAIAMWVSGGRHRRMIRELSQANVRNSRELKELRSSNAHASEPSGDTRRISGPVGQGSA